MPSKRAAMAMRNDSKVREFILRSLTNNDSERHRFGSVCAQMMDSEWWREVPERDEPAPVSGEIDG